MDERGFPCFRDGQVERCGPNEFAIRARGIEMRVVGNDVALRAHHSEKNAFRGAALVSGNNVAKTENRLHRIAKPREARGASVRFVAPHNGSPLFSGHRGGAGVGKQVDENVFGRDEEKVVAGGFNKFLALFASGCTDGLDALDAKRLNNRADGHGAWPSLQTLTHRKLNLSPSRSTPQSSEARRAMP